MLVKVMKTVNLDNVPDFLLSILEEIKHLDLESIKHFMAEGNFLAAAKAAAAAKENLHLYIQKMDDVQRLLVQYQQILADVLEPPQEENKE